MRSRRGLGGRGRWRNVIEPGGGSRTRRSASRRRRRRRRRGRRRGRERGDSRVGRGGVAGRGGARARGRGRPRRGERRRWERGSSGSTSGRSRACFLAPPPARCVSRHFRIEARTDRYRVCGEKDDGSTNGREWREATRKGAIKKAKGTASRAADSPARSLSASSSSCSLRPLRSSPMARRQEVWLAWALVALACVYGRYWDLRLPRPLPASAPASVFSEARALALAGALESAGPRVAGSSAEARAFDAIESRLRAIQADADDERGRGRRGRHAHDARGVFAPRAQGARRSRDDHGVRRPDHPRDPRPRRELGRGRPRVPRGVPPRTWTPSTSPEAATTASASPSPSRRRGPSRRDWSTITRTTPQRRRRLVELGNLSSRSSPGRSDRAFVSAEEDGFKGAHAFATSHPWMTHARRGCGLNLESMGAGGPHRMFQVTRGASSDALLRLWSRSAPRPSGTVIASDIFASGLISSDTDHRIWRDAATRRADFAFLEKTRDYHTGDALQRAALRRPRGEPVGVRTRARLKPPERGGESGGDDKDDDDPASASTRSGRTDPGGPGETRRADRPRRGRKEPARRSRLRERRTTSPFRVGPPPRLFYALGAFATPRRRGRVRAFDRDAWTSFAALAAPLACAGVLGSGSPRRSRGPRRRLAGKLGDVPGVSWRTSPRSSWHWPRPRRCAGRGPGSDAEGADGAEGSEPSRGGGGGAAGEERRRRGAGAAQEDDAEPTRNPRGGGPKEDARKEKFLPARSLASGGDWTLPRRTRAFLFAAARLFDAGVGGAYLFALAALAGFATRARRSAGDVLFQSRPLGERSSPGGFRVRPSEPGGDRVGVFAAFLAFRPRASSRR